MPVKIDPELISVRLTGRTRAQTNYAVQHLEPDHWTASTLTWLKPIDKTRLLYRIKAVLSNMGGREEGRVALQSIRRAVEALPDPEQPTMRPATAEEEASYVDGTKVIDGADETEHGLQVPVTDEPTPVTHVLDREKVSIGGFLSEDRSAGHVERTQRPRKGYRLLVQGSDWYPGFGICGSDSDLWNNLGEGLGTAKGPNLWGYGQAGVIDNHGGTKSEIEREEAEGMIIRCSIGDLFQIEDPILGTLTYRLQFEDGWGRVDRHNIKFVRAKGPTWEEA